MCRTCDASMIVLLLAAAGAAGCGSARPSEPLPTSAPRRLTDTSRSPAAASVEAFRDAIRPLIADDYAGAVAPLRRAAELDPGNDIIVYLSAAAASRTHDRQAALDWLARLDALHSDLVPDPADFADLAGDPRSQAITARIAARAAAESQEVTEAFRIAEAGLGPEGIAYDPATGGFFVGSIQQHKIVRVRDGRSEDFAASSRGRLPVLGLRVDARRRLLWAACEGEHADDGGDGAAHGGAPPAGSELIVFDADTGARKAQYPAPAAGKHLLNDIALRSDGAAFVTDSEAGQVWAALSDATSLSAVVPPERFVYPNGIAWDDGHRALLVADTVAIWQVDPDTGATRPLAAPPGVSLVGLDGMYLDGDWIIGVQNLAGPGRVVGFALSADHTRVTERRVLAAIHPAFDAPTTGAIGADGFYLLANSQIRSKRPPAPTIVLRMPLPWR